MHAVLCFCNEKRSLAKLFHTQVQIGGAETIKNWENFQEVIPIQFLAKLGLGRAQLRVFGCSGAIEAIYFSF